MMKEEAFELFGPYVGEMIIKPQIDKNPIRKYKVFVLTEIIKPIKMFPGKDELNEKETKCKYIYIYIYI